MTCPGNSIALLLSTSHLVCNTNITNICRRSDTHLQHKDGTACFSITSSFSALRRHIHSGRPDLEAHFRRVVALAGGEGQAVTAMVCGPEQLMEGVSQAAFRHGTGYHTEHFTF